MHHNQKMQCEYTLSFAEFREGIVLVPIKDPAAIKRSKFWSTAIVIPTAIILFLVVTRNPLQSESQPVPQNLWVTLAPTLAVMLWLLTATATASIRSWRIARASLASNTATTNQPQTAILEHVAWLAFAFLLLPMFPALAIRWSPTPADIEWVEILPWIVFLFAIFGMSRFTTWATHLKAFATQRSQRRHLKLTANEAGMVLDTGPSQSHLGWASFDRYEEKKQVLQLVTEDERIIIIPKRAISDAIQMMTLRSLIQTNIARGNFLPGEARFPVILTPA